MSDSIEAAAKVIDPLAFQPVGSCNPRGYESHTQEALSRVIAARRRHALRVAERVVAAYHDAELAALRAQIEGLQAAWRTLSWLMAEHPDIEELVVQRAERMKSIEKHNAEWAILQSHETPPPGPDRSPARPDVAD